LTKACQAYLCHFRVLYIAFPSRFFLALAVDIFEMTAIWAVPVGVLSAICVAMFVFIWWWFPRHYQKGVRADMAMYDEQRRQRELAEAEANMGTNNVSEVPAETTSKPPPAYTPPTYTSY